MVKFIELVEPFVFKSLKIIYSDKPQEMVLHKMACLFLLYGAKSFMKQANYKKLLDENLVKPYELGKSYHLASKFIILRSNIAVTLHINQRWESYQKCDVIITRQYKDERFKKLDIILKCVLTPAGYLVNKNQKALKEDRYLTSYLRKNGINIPHKDKNTTIGIARLICALGQNVTGWEVHHSDNVRNNNHESNLKLIDPKMHQQIHKNDEVPHYYNTIPIDCGQNNIIKTINTSLLLSSCINLKTPHTDNYNGNQPVLNIEKFASIEVSEFEGLSTEEQEAYIKFGEEVTSNILRVGSFIKQRQDNFAAIHYARKVDEEKSTVTINQEIGCICSDSKLEERIIRNYNTVPKRILKVMFDYNLILRPSGLVKPDLIYDKVVNDGHKAYLEELIKSFNLINATFNLQTKNNYIKEFDRYTKNLETWLKKSKDKA